MTLQVAFNNQIISNSVVFEYKARALPTLPSSQHDWLSLDGKNGVLVTLLLGTEGEELVHKRKSYKRINAGRGQEGVSGSAREDLLSPPIGLSIYHWLACVWSLAHLIFIQPLLGTDEICELACGCHSCQGVQVVQQAPGSCEGPSSKSKQLLFPSAASLLLQEEEGVLEAQPSPTPPGKNSSVGAVGAPQAQALFRFRGLGGQAVPEITSHASPKLATPVSEASWLFWFKPLPCAAFKTGLSS